MFWYNKTLVEFDLLQRQISFSGSRDVRLSFASSSVTCHNIVQQVFSGALGKKLGQSFDAHHIL